LTQAAGLSINSRPGILSITDARLFGPGQEARGVLFARRVLRFPEVRSLEIDPLHATATLRYGAPPGASRALVRRLADAVTGDEAVECGCLPPWRAGETVTLRRHGGIITTLEIVTLGHRRLEARHRAIGREPAMARRIEDVLRQSPGVLQASVNAETVSVVLDPAVTSAARLLRLVETELAPPGEHSAPRAARVRFEMANVSLGVTVIGEFLLPGVMPVAAGLLVFTNVDTVGAAASQLREGKVGLPVLYGSILAMTLVSGQFLSAALMFWCFRGWEHCYRKDLEVETQAILDESLGVPEQVRMVTVDGRERLVPRSEIDTGQRLRVRAGRRVPVDATVIDGAALVDEVTLGGGEAPVTRIKGDEVLAGSRLVAGELDLVALRTGRQTRAAEVARALLAATAPAPAAWALNRNAEAFADRMVPPTVAAAGFGLLVGGPATANAMLRPDFATAAGLAGPLETLRDVRIALRHGALIRSREAMSRFAASSWVVLDDHEALRQADCELVETQVRGIEEDQLLPALAAAGVWLGDPRGLALVRGCRSRGLIARKAGLREIDATGVAINYGRHVLRLRGHRDRTGLAPLRVEVDGVEVAAVRFRATARLAAAASVRRLQRAGLSVFLASEHATAMVEPLARRLGVDRHLGDMDARSRRSLLKALGERGVGVVHVHLGGAPRDPGDAHLSVALRGADGVGCRDADIVLFGPSIAPLPALATLARDSVTRVRHARIMAMAPNLACIAGAFAFGFTGLAVVVISNLGTSMVYNRARRALHSDRVADAWTLEADGMCITDDGASVPDGRTMPAGGIQQVME